jgi:hypothetical protein
MNYLICAGGSGVRVLESMIHLCAMGLGPDELRVLAVDPDNANASRVKALIDNYQDVRGRLDGNTGPRLKLFHTKLNLFDVADATKGLKVWSPVNAGGTLQDLLGYGNLPEATQDIAHLFFTKDELGMDLYQGFRGHTAIGAAAMSMVTLFKDKQPWEKFAKDLQDDLRVDAGARVFIAASVFGGTGASAIHPLARFVRKLAAENSDRLRIGVAALVPYFSFQTDRPSTTDERSMSEQEKKREREKALAVRAEQFPLATYSAAQYYQHLRSNDDWDFTSMYWMGDSSQMKVPFALGGAEQANPPHFVDLLAALSALGFYVRRPEKAGSRGACYYAGPRQRVEPALGRTNILDWADLPLAGLQKDAVRRDLLSAFVAGVAHLGFCRPLLNNPGLNQQPYCVPWYFKRFMGRQESLTTQGNDEAMQKLTEYFSVHMFPWWNQVLEPDNVRLFNRRAIQIDDEKNLHIDLSRLANVLFPDDPSKITADAIDRFFTDMVEVPLDRTAGKGTGAYLTLLSQASDRFVDREYVKRMTTEDRSA